MSENGRFSQREILEKLGKLLALNEEAGATKYEAESAAKKAQELLISYNLSMASVDDHLRKGEMGITHQTYNLSDIWRKSESSWIWGLYDVIAGNNFCSMITVQTPYTKSRRGTIIVGKVENVEIVQFICEQLVPRIRVLEGRAWVKYCGMEKKGRFRRGFLWGGCFWNW